MGISTKADSNNTLSKYSTKASSAKVTDITIFEY